MVPPFLKSMARMEGYYLKGSRPARNLNPGDIEAGRFASAHGAIASDNRFAVFPTEAAGFAAMHALLQTPGYRGLTVHAALNRWAPPVENDTSAYEAAVCEWTPCHPSDIIDTLLGDPPNA